MPNKNLVIPPSVSVSGDDVTTWALPEGAIARLGRGDVNDIAFSPNGQYLAAATDIGIWLYTLPTLSPIALWDTENGHTEVVTFSPDSRWVAAYSNNEETLKIWDVQTGVCLAQMEDSYQPGSCRPIFSQDGSTFLVGLSNGVRKPVNYMTKLNYGTHTLPTPLSLSPFLQMEVW